MSMKKRSDRYKQPKDESNSFDRLFYWLIAGLFVVLIAIIIFIFVSGGDSVEQVSDDLVQQTEESSDHAGAVDKKDEASDKNEQTDKAADKQTTQKKTQNQTQNQNQTQQQTPSNQSGNHQQQGQERQQGVNQQGQQPQRGQNQTTTNGDTSIVNETPPHDTNHYTDFSDGSSDRLEIRDKVSTVTGISESDMIERWIGNDGIARVEATVESRSTGAKYIVYLQYGNGQWHVESVHNN
ncbi:YrrS family protein [Dolosigranulum savutiense]|uniref:YrrS family protein n=1 Tax=Dolosigranulum savutiense TaxID=3110288 RepID=A0AB74TZC3_9LACT